MNNYFSISFNDLIHRVITRHGNFLHLGASAILISCAGCATGDVASFHYAPADQTAAARDATVPAGKALLFVYEFNTLQHEPKVLQMGQTILQVDQKDVCRLAYNTFYRTTLEPGRHQLALRFVGNWADAGLGAQPIHVEKELLLDLTPDNAYYFQGFVDSGLQSAGLLSTSLEPRISVDLKRHLELFGWKRRTIIDNRALRLTGELIEP
jgi:hypothetical protein